MTYLLVLAVITAVFFAGALLVSTVERTSGTFGDSSLVPGILVLWFVVVVITTIVGLSTGAIGVWIR